MTLTLKSFAKDWRLFPEISFELLIFTQKSEIFFRKTVNSFNSYANKAQAFVKINIYKVNQFG